MAHEATIEELHDFRIRDEERDRILGLIDELIKKYPFTYTLKELKSRIKG